MFKTKAELAKAHRDGRLKDMAVHGISNSFSAVIVHIDHDNGRVFGYLSGGGTDKHEYFFVKLRDTENSYTFKVGKLNFDINQFMRI